MKRFVVLVLALAIATPSLADDLVESPWRGRPSSTFSEWTYDDDVGVYENDFPDSSWFTYHPEKLDPEDIDPCNPGFFSAQRWGGDNDPCSPDWIDLPSGPAGRYGVINFAYGSWDINNFVGPSGVHKDIWVQVTYFTDGGAVDWSYELEAFEQIPIEGEEGPADVFLDGDLVPLQETILGDGWVHMVFGITVTTPGNLATESLSCTPMCRSWSIRLS